MLQTWTQNIANPEQGAHRRYDHGALPQYTFQYL